MSGSQALLCFASLRPGAKITSILKRVHSLVFVIENIEKKIKCYYNVSVKSNFLINTIFMNDFRFRLKFKMNRDPEVRKTLIE